MKLTNATTNVARPANVTNQMGHPKQSLADMGIKPGGPHFTQDGLSLSSRPGASKPGHPGQGNDIRPGGPFPIGEKPRFDSFRPGGLGDFQPLPGVEKPGFPGACRPGIPAGLGEPKVSGHGVIDFHAMKPTGEAATSRPGAEADAGRKTFPNPFGEAANWMQHVLR
jgi:hypothetical protein